MLIEPNKKYKVWSEAYVRDSNRGTVPITWAGISKDKLEKYFPTWKELQGHPIKAVRHIWPNPTPIKDDIWMVQSLRYGFKFRLNMQLIHPPDDIRDSFKLKCICDSRQLFISGCECGGI